MLQLVADRFVPDSQSWIDLATGAPARVRILSVAGAAAQRAFAERCGSLALLRHPFINPLIDHGSSDAARVFEAYADIGPLRIARRSASWLLLHASRFLERHGIALEQGGASFVLREVADGPPLRGRPVGIVLRRSAALDALIDVLDAHAPAGAVDVDVRGTSGSGLRTLRVLVAREARIRGYIPVAASLVQRWPALHELLTGRHVCLLLEEPLSDAARHGVALCLARLASASARRHVIVRFRRDAGSASSLITLEPIGAAAMAAMVFVDPDAGPSAAELFDAARSAGGRPGVFLEALNAIGFEPRSPRLVLVRETAAVYEAPARTDRGVLSRAPVRGRELAVRGRHAAAARLLSRAARVQEARGHKLAAAECSYELGWVARARGRSAAALEAFDRAAASAGETALALASVISRGIVQTDETQLVEAEATLRGAMVAAQQVRDTPNQQRAALALARALMWQGRTDEASVLMMSLLSEVADGIAAEGWALTARIRLLDAHSRAALEAARLALAAAERSPVLRHAATAHRAMALVLMDLGDAERSASHVRLGLAAARAAHLPLLATRLRAVAVRGSVSVASQRIAAGRVALPRLLEIQLLAASGGNVQEIARQSGARALARPAPSRRFADVEMLLELAHGAPDERAALERICQHVCDRLRACSAIVMTAGERRVLALAGKPSPGEWTACAHALASGRSVTPECPAEPRQAAAPIRYGGHIIAALGCRWVAATVVTPAAVEEVLHSAALASAGSVRALADQIPPQAPPSGWNDLIGESAAAAALRDSVARAARAPFPVLILGESGSGKELVARAIHRQGSRRDRRWCAVNCAAISDDLLEAELFGHTRGAYTGAVGERAGLFEEADGGTLFLDEVGDLSPRAQAKLLRVLQDGEVRRVGENLPRRVDVRVVAATNRPLDGNGGSGSFRADLRFRLDVVRIVVPPLRDRVADIPLLAAHFWRAASAQVGSCATFAPETLAALARYDWPGNVRELQNVIAWMAVHSPRRGRIGPSALPANLAQATSPSSGTFEVAREEFERRFVRAALARAGGRRSMTADALGVSRQGLAKMLRRLNIEAP